MTNKVREFYCAPGCWSEKFYGGVVTDNFSGISLWDLHENLWRIVDENRKAIRKLNKCYIDDNGKWMMTVDEDDSEYYEYYDYCDTDDEDCSDGVIDISVPDDSYLGSILKRVSNDEIKRVTDTNRKLGEDFESEKTRWSNHIWCERSIGEYDRNRMKALNGDDYGLWCFTHDARAVVDYINEFIAIVKKYREWFFDYNYNDIMEVIDMYADGVKKDLRKLRNE